MTYHNFNTATKKSIRAAVAADNPTAMRLRFTRAGEVLAYGVMPNSIVTGWYLVRSSGYDLDYYRDLGINW